MKLTLSQSVSRALQALVNYHGKKQDDATTIFLEERKKIYAANVWRDETGSLDGYSKLLVAVHYNIRICGLR